MEYKYKKTAGALQEAMAEAGPPQRSSSHNAPRMRHGGPPGAQALVASQMMVDDRMDFGGGGEALESLPRSVRAERMQQLRSAPAAPAASDGVDRTRRLGRSGMFFYTVEEGQRVLRIAKNGKMDIVEGPARVWRWGYRFQAMSHHVAHPGEFLIVRFRDGEQDHRAGPAHVWLDPRAHLAVEKEDILQIASKEAVVVYAQKDGQVTRRIEHGPAAFVPRPGEWLHTFSWHGSAGGGEGFRKVPNALVFQKLWLMPDQMYHDVPDVRTADDAVLTIRLMIFFELVDIEKMLATSHDPIGDFVNAATSDLVEFVGRHDFEAFKSNVDKLNDLGAYRQLTERAKQCGYVIHKVVYRGYGAPESLQEMHDKAIESRTRLALERATEQQAQELEDFRQERQLSRSTKQRQDHIQEVEQEIALQRRREQAELESQAALRALHRDQSKLDVEQETNLARARDEARRAHLDALSKLGVDLTSYLTQGRADQVIELRGNGSPAHLHVEPSTRSVQG